METQDTSEWVYLVPHLRFGLPNQQTLYTAGAKRKER